MPPPTTTARARSMACEDYSTSDSPDYPETLAEFTSLRPDYPGARVRSRYSGSGCCLVSGRRKRSSAPATAATPPSSIAPPSPVVADSTPTASSPAMLPTAPGAPHHPPPAQHPRNAPPPPRQPERRFRRRARASRKQLSRPGTENGGRRAGKAAPEHVADEKADRPGGEAEAGRARRRDRQGDGRRTAAEAVGEISARKVRDRAHGPGDDDEDADFGRRPSQHEAGVDRVDQARRLEQYRKQGEHRREDQDPTSPGRLHEQAQGRPGDAYALPRPTLGQQPPDQRRREHSHAAHQEQQSPVGGENRVGDHGDAGPESGEQRQHADRLAATSRRSLFHDERRGHAEHENFEADREQPQECEPSQGTHKAAGEVDQREAGDSDGDQPPPAVTVREIREGKGAERADGEDRTERRQSRDVGVELPGDGGQRQDQDRALESGEHDGEPRPDERDALPPVEFDQLDKTHLLQ